MISGDENHGKQILNKGALGRHSDGGMMYISDGSTVTILCGGA